jgi:hypothetical protein
MTIYVKYSNNLKANIFTGDIIPYIEDIVELQTYGCDEETINNWGFNGYNFLSDKAQEVAMVWNQYYRDQSIPCEEEVPVHEDSVRYQELRKKIQELSNELFQPDCSTNKYTAWTVGLMLKGLLSEEN